MPKNKIKVYTKDRGVLDIKVVPNQKVIEIHKVKEKGAGILDIAANKRAMKNLTANAYTLYMHFVLNIPGYKEALSLSYILENTSLSERGYYNAIKELIDKQYIIKEYNKEYSNYYLFFEDPSLNFKKLISDSS